jgi:hypothetical protein
MEKSGGDITEGQANEDAPFGQIEAHPLRVQDEHGMPLSHFNLSLAVLLVRWIIRDGGEIQTVGILHMRWLRGSASTLALCTCLDLLRRYVPSEEGA